MNPNWFDWISLCFFLFFLTFHFDSFWSTNRIDWIETRRRDIISYVRGKSRAHTTSTFTRDAISFLPRGIIVEILFLRAPSGGTGMCIESFSPFVEFLEFHLVAVAFRRALKPIKFHCLLQFSYRVQSLAGSPPDSDRDPWKLPSSCSALPLRFTHLTLDIDTKWEARKKKKRRFQLLLNGHGGSTSCVGCVLPPNRVPVVSWKCIRQSFYLAANYPKRTD